MTTPAPGAPGRWPYLGPPQKRMLVAALAVWGGVGLPWFVFRPLGITRYASPLAASWVLWAGLMAIAGAVVRWKLVAVFSAVAGAATALSIGFWQTLVILDNCGFRFQLQCFPGPGVFVVQAAAGFALYQAYRMFRFG